MNIQKLILSAIRALPGWLVGKMAGPPLEIDGYRLDPHMHLASKSADLGAGDGDIEAYRAGAAAGAGNDQWPAATLREMARHRVCGPRRRAHHAPLQTSKGR